MYSITYNMGTINSYKILGKIYYTVHVFKKDH